MRVIPALLFAVLGAAHAVAAAGSEEPALAPFSAHYSADWKTINVGTSDLELKRDGDAGRYVYTWTITARGIFRLFYSDDVVQESWFAVHSGHIRPQRYRAHEGASSVSVDFEWNGTGKARGQSEGKPVDLTLPAGTQDLLSIQTELMLELQSGRWAPGEERIFNIVEKDAVKDFVYALEPPARLRTSIGTLDTMVVTSRRPGSNRLLRMWFAPSLGYAPVQAERTRDGKLEFALRIRSLSP